MTQIAYKIKERIVITAKRLMFNLHSRDLKITSICGYYLKTRLLGINNTITIGSNCYINFPEVIMSGENNSIIIGDRCHIGPNCSFRLEGRNLCINIENGCSFNSSVHFCAQEENVCIHVGSDCMFSSNISIRTSDSHPIIDSISGQRINPPGCVTIDNHVWVAPDSKIMKGVHIGSGSIIGSDAVVTKSVPMNCMVAGVPAKIVKTDVSWCREAAFANYLKR